MKHQARKTRREFLQITAGAGVALCGASLISSRAATALTTGKERSSPAVDPLVVVARDDKLTPEPGKVNGETARKLLDEAILRITGAKSPRKGWQKLFSSKDRVGIKINCLAGANLSPGPALVFAIVDGLRSAGVRENNIVIWDRLSRELGRVGFRINSSSRGVRCFGTDDLRGTGYDNEISFAGSIGSCFSRILSTYCTAIVNVPILKDHDLAGVSLGMKNFYGGIHNPNKYHDNNCDPYVADLNTHPYIKDRLRLVVCDASRGVYHGGPSFKPQFAWTYSGLLVSRDPVAVDRVGAQLIEQKRKDAGMQSLKESEREPKHIRTAAERGLGVDDLSKIEKIMV